MRWEEYPRAAYIKGVRIDGDPTAWPTRWWNRWYQERWGWKNAAHFMVPLTETFKGYRIGYIPFDGPAMICAEPIEFPHQFFRMRIGREPRTVFAVDAGGWEIELHPFGIYPIDRKDFGHVLLL